MIDQACMSRSWRSVLSFKSSVFIFLRSMTCWMSIEWKMCKEKKILCVALWSRIWLWNGSTYWSWRSLRRHDLSFTGYVSRQGVKDVSGPKRSRLLVLNCPVSGTVTPDRSAELHKWYTSATMVQQWLSPSTHDSTLATGRVTLTGEDSTWEWSMLRQWKLAGSRQQAGGIASGV